jgi:hypothetical protein
MIEMDTPVSEEAVVHDILDSAVVLGGEVAGYTELDVDSMQSYLGDRVNGLTRALGNLGGRYMITYNGTGFTGTTDYMGDSETVHKKVFYARGVLIGIEIHDSDFYEHYDPMFIDRDDVKDDYEDEYEHFHEDDDMATIIKEFESDLLLAPENVRLYGQFLVSRNDEFEWPIAGASYVARDIHINDYIDLSTIEIINVAKIDELLSEVVPYESVGYALQNFAQVYQKKVQSLKFRKLSADRQRTLLEKNVRQVNERAGLERFSIIVHSGKFYIPKVENGIMKYESIELGEEITGRGLRIDCLELQSIEAGVPTRKRKGSVSSSDSLCVVLDIGKARADALELGSTIVWVPLIDQADEFTLPLRYIV